MSTPLWYLICDEAECAPDRPFEVVWRRLQARASHRTLDEVKDAFLASDSPWKALDGKGRGEVSDDLRVRANAAAAEQMATMSELPPRITPLRDALRLAWLNGYQAGHGDATAFAVEALNR